MLELLSRRIITIFRPIKDHGFTVESVLIEIFNPRVNSYWFGINLDETGLRGLGIIGIYVM